MLSRLSLFAKYSQSPLPSTPSSNRPSSPLEVSELLQHIFSFLSQRSLRTAILVCRQWFHLNHHCLNREGIWDVRWERSLPFKTLSRLVSAERLVLKNNQTEISWNSPDLRRLLQCIQAAKGYDLCTLLGIDIGALIKTVSRSYPIKGFTHPPRELVFSSYDFKEEWVHTPTKAKMLFRLVYRSGP
ncbi:hypothetical protein F5H01DRAFT_393039 [Linnemannia elongata]|nr:hypothetical protein F5H01DRAFT_393039 [Linnemannia elongata]